MNQFEYKDYQPTGKTLSDHSQTKTQLVKCKKNMTFYIKKEYLYTPTTKQTVKVVAQRLINLDHPNIVKGVQVFDLQSISKLVCISQHCEKKLYQFFSANKDNTQLLNRVMLQIAEGVRYLHDKNKAGGAIIHRNLQLDKILIKNQVAKISGLGSSIDAYQTNITKTLLNVFGAQAYMPIQMLEQEQEKYTKKIDIWSLGVIFLQILTKKSVIELIKDNINTPLAKRQNFPDEFLDKVKDTKMKNLVKGMLKQYQQDRIEIQDVVNTLRDIVDPKSMPIIQQKKTISDWISKVTFKDLINKIKPNSQFKLIEKTKKKTIQLCIYNGQQIVFTTISYNQNKQTRKALKDQLNRRIKLKHKNILQTYHYIQDDYNSHIHIFEQYAPEGNIRMYINKYQPSLNTKKVFMKQLCQAIMYIHKQQEYHKNIKMQNVLMKAGDVKLADFKTVQSYKNELQYTMQGKDLILQNYVPSQLYYSDQYTTAVDVWYLGFVFYEMVSGVPFYSYNNPNDKKGGYMKVKQKETFPDKEKMSLVKSPQMYKLIHQMLQIEPQKRPNMQNVMDRLS